MHSVRFRTEVADDLASARTWYEARSEGLGAEFIGAVDALLERIARAPLEFPVVHAGVIRRGHLRRFPFSVFFLKEEQHIVVLAVLHGAVDPRRWTTRTEP